MCDYCGCRLEPAIESCPRNTSSCWSSPTSYDGGLLSLLQRRTDKEERGIFAQLRSTWTPTHASTRRSVSTGT